MLRIVYSRDFQTRSLRIQVIIDDEDIIAANLPSIELRPREYLSLPSQLRNLASILEELEANQQMESDMLNANGDVSLEELLNMSEEPDPVEEDEEVEMEEEELEDEEEEEEEWEDDEEEEEEDEEEEEE